MQLKIYAQQDRPAEVRAGREKVRERTNGLQKGLAS